jgi:hypothetical protein
MGEVIMDTFELKPEKKKVNRKSLVWNFLTVIVLLGIFCVGFYFLSIFNNPKSFLNPFPPAQVPTLFQTTTPTPTILLQPATWTPTITDTPEASRTKAPTWTLLPEMVTPTDTLTPGITPTISTTQTSAVTSMPASAVITYEPSTDFHADKGCKWLGVAGKVLGTDGKPVLNQYIQMGGILDAKGINYLTLSSTASIYGAAGFEFVLSDHPIASSQSLWIQLFDNNFKPLTNKIPFDTFADCAKNLVMVTFTTTR